MRSALRVIFATVVTLGVLFLIAMDGGRGFLPQSRRTLFVDLAMNDAGGWSASLFKIAPETDEGEPPKTGVLRVRLAEQSMGRRKAGGGWSMWRCTSWFVCDVLSPDGSIVSPSDYAESEPPEAQAALDRFVEREIVPKSPAMRIWPEQPRELRRDAPGWWSVSQNRTSWTLVVTYCAVALGIGLGVAHVVVRWALASTSVSRTASTVHEGHRNSVL